jgi:hypothetical protein
MQKDDNGREYVVAYASRKVAEAESKWAIRELEALAIIWGCEHYRPYLFGSQFTVRSDHHSLQWLMRAGKGRLARWALRLQEFNFNIQYRPGRGNPHADALSRNPTLSEGRQLTVDAIREEVLIPSQKITSATAAMYVWRKMCYALYHSYSNILPERGRSFVEGGAALCQTVANVALTVNEGSESQQDVGRPYVWLSQEDQLRAESADDSTPVWEEIALPHEDVPILRAPQPDARDRLQEEARWWKEWEEKYKREILAARDRVEAALASKPKFRALQQADPIIVEWRRRVSVLSEGETNAGRVSFVT